VMECSGNTRSWRFGLLSAARWTGGIKLTDILFNLGNISPSLLLKPDQKKHILIEGYDRHSRSGGGRMGASWIFPQSKIKDIFIAWEMNGEPLPKDHGFPLRLVVPNWLGCTHIKWVTGIFIVDGDKVKPTSQMEEFRGRVHASMAPRNRASDWSARMGLSATPWRVERWRDVTDDDGGGNVVYKIVGLLWGSGFDGGDVEEDNYKLMIRFNGIKFIPVEYIKPRSSSWMWTQWCHIIPHNTINTDTKIMEIQLGIESQHKNIYTPRLKLVRNGLKTWYMRKFRII